ncbi:hypothetical protein DRN69_05245 [Candidatus Pacearchaeota archaeon]|nr:MAG: hypothetical protein DRN69_05245 [Candidatus Pacearchaeota archaeon]
MKKSNFKQLGEIRIKAIFEDVCNKLGIILPTKLNKQERNINKDAQYLADIYLQLKKIIGKLSEIENHYKLKSIRNILEHFIQELTNIDHDIIKITNKLIKEK